MWKVMGAVWLALAIGCVAPEPELEATSEVEQRFSLCTDCECPGCGGNGVRQSEWSYVFSNVDRNALKLYGLWDDVTDSPASLCKPATITASSCEVRNLWVDWMAGEPTAQRRGIFVNLVKIVLQDGDTIRAPAAAPYSGRFWLPHGPTVLEGEFGLMLHAAGSVWGPQGREIATAGLLALLSAVDGVPVCLNTPQLPDHCAGSGRDLSESVTFGDALLGGRFVGIWGSKDAPFPARNARFGTVSPDSATIFNNALNTCNTEGQGDLRHPVRCRHDGRTWHNVVHVLVARDALSRYYVE